VTIDFNNLPLHPMTATFPPMPPGQQQSLNADVEAKGLLHPIVLLDGKLLDGRSRLAACLVADIEPTSIELPSDTDPASYLLSVNLARRPMTPSQTAMAVVACSLWVRTGENQFTGGLEPGSTPATNDSMARMANVSIKSIQQAKIAYECGLLEPVRDGLVSVKRAAEIARLPEGEREAAMSAPRSPRRARMPQEVAALQDIINEHEDEIGDLSEALDAKEEAVASLETQVVALRAEISARDQKIVELSQAIDAKDRACASSQAEVENLKRALAEREVQCLRSSWVLAATQEEVELRRITHEKEVLEGIPSSGPVSLQPDLAARARMPEASRLVEAARVTEDLAPHFDQRVSTQRSPVRIQVQPRVTSDSSMDLQEEAVHERAQDENDAGGCGQSPIARHPGVDDPVVEDLHAEPQVWADHGLVTIVAVPPEGFTPGIGHQVETEGAEGQEDLAEAVESTLEEVNSVATRPSDVEVSAPVQEVPAPSASQVRARRVRRTRAQLRAAKEALEAEILAEGAVFGFKGGFLQADGTPVNVTQDEGIWHLVHEDGTRSRNTGKILRVKPSGWREVIEGADQASRGLTPDEALQFAFMSLKYKDVSRLGSDPAALQGLCSEAEPQPATSANIVDPGGGLPRYSQVVVAVVGNGPPGCPGALATASPRM